MTQPLAVLQLLAKLERVEPAASKPTPSSCTSLPPLPLSSPSPVASDADDCSVVVQSARPALSSRRSHSHSRAPSLPSPLQPPVRPRSPSSPPDALLPWHSSHGAEKTEEREEEEEEEDEMRLHAQFRLKQRLKEKTRVEAGRRARQQARPRDDFAEDEDEEEREARLTSLAHRTMPPSPVIRNRSLKDGSSSGAADDELGVPHKQTHSAGGGSGCEEEKCSEDDVRGTDERATIGSAGAATFCLRVAKRLPQPGKSYSQLVHSSRADTFQSPLSSYASSPTLLSTASTAGPSPAVSIPSITRSVLSQSIGSTYRSSTFASPHTYASLLASPLSASPSVLPSVLPLSPLTDECGGKLRLLETRPCAIFSRRHLT